VSVRPDPSGAGSSPVAARGALGSTVAIFDQVRREPRKLGELRVNDV
jgi:hypothetical protein